MLESRAAWLVVFTLAAVALKVTTFGDPYRGADETFYFLVGQRMHEGLVPYVDIWDRKPLGLFLAYYLIAGISASVLSYQIVACLLASATAMIVALIVERLAGRLGAVFAGFSYLLAINPVEGASGQTPDFYNLLIAGAALLILDDRGALARRSIGWRSWSAMALCGCALTFKQTAFFESAFLGLWLIWSLRQAGATGPVVLRAAGACCAIGAAPSLAIAAWYWQADHFSEYWQAMVTSNLAREGQPIATIAWNGFCLLLRLVVVLPLALVGLLRFTPPGDARRFLALWLTASVVGFLAVPAFTLHYILPVLVPLTVGGGIAFQRMRSPLVAFALLATVSLLWQPIDQRAVTRNSGERLEHLAELIRVHDGGGGLLVYEGPAYLYAMTGKRFLTPLSLPYHLNDLTERNVSHLDTDAEIDRVLTTMPGVILLARYPQTQPVNLFSRDRVLRYVHTRCTLMGSDDVAGERRTNAILVFGECGSATANRKPEMLKHRSPV